MRSFYRILSAIGHALQSPFLLVVRLFWGISFMQTGLGKFANIDKVIGYFSSLGIPLPQLNAYLAATVEVFGGLCLLLGLASRFVPLLLIGLLTVAYLTAEKMAVQTLFTNPQNFVHATPFNFLMAALIVFIFGPGKISLDYILGRTVFRKN